MEEAETGGDSLDAELDALLDLVTSVEDLQKERGRSEVSAVAGTGRHPLSFVIMAFRFLGLALSGRFEETYALAAPGKDGETIEPAAEQARCP